MKLVTTVIIGLGVSLIILLLIVSFITNWDFLSTTSSIKDDFFDIQNESKFQEESSSKYLESLNNFWKDCKDNETLKRYVTGKGNFDKEYIFSNLKNLSWCNALQSVTYGCGAREDIIMDDIVLPQIIIARCYNGSLLIYT